MSAPRSGDETGRPGREREEQLAYERELAERTAQAHPLTLAICRAWHGEHFGEPGRGSLEFVITQLWRADQAREVCVSHLSAGDRA